MARITSLLAFISLTALGSSSAIRAPLPLTQYWSLISQAENTTATYFPIDKLHVGFILDDNCANDLILLDADSGIQDMTFYGRTNDTLSRHDIEGGSTYTLYIPEIGTDPEHELRPLQMACNKGTKGVQPRVEGSNVLLGMASQADGQFYVCRAAPRGDPVTQIFFRNAGVALPDYCADISLHVMCAEGTTQPGISSSSCTPSNATSW